MTETLLPLLAVLAVGCFAPSGPRDHVLFKRLMSFGFLILLARYLWWRVVETVLPAAGSIAEVGFVYVVFAAELWLWSETGKLSLLLFRRTDRRPEADLHEKRLAECDPEVLPSVDVFIATYNEPLDVLEKTIAGAGALDWPQSRLNIYVLDDGRRDWLKEYCFERGITHLTRDNNSHAKAGNINAALPITDGEFILILDADFVPQRRMLMRAIGFFEDPRVGIVQIPHFFFNFTPIQTNMDIRHGLPDEQRFFFDVIQPGRDGWDCAFCCGSNGILRRSAVESIGGAMPTDSITEDMLLTLALLRKGFVTRYLGERLAIGLAPESMEAYFVQRERWARGAVQMLYTSQGPLGPGLTPLQRVLFSPSHWLSQSVCQPIAMATPAVFLLTGFPPLIGATLSEIFSIQLPAIAAAMVFLSFLAPREFAPVASTVESVLQSFRLLPGVFWTVIKPRGHAFRVTPKGKNAQRGQADRFTILTCLALIVATGTGLHLNSSINTRIVGDVELLPVVVFWSVFNMIILLVVITASVPKPVLRAEERFPLERACRLSGVGTTWTGQTVDVSISGALIELDPDIFADAPTPERGQWLMIELAGIGRLAARVQRRVYHDETISVGVLFDLPQGATREGLLVALFASGVPTEEKSRKPLGLLPTLVAQIFAPEAKKTNASSGLEPSSEPPPDWLTAMLAGSSLQDEVGSRFSEDRL